MAYEALKSLQISFERVDTDEQIKVVQGFLTYTKHTLAVIQIEAEK